MLHRRKVTADVGLTMRNVIVQWTPYTLHDPDFDQTGFRFTLVPKAKRWEGWRASKRSWDVLLSKIVQALHEKRPEYASLDVTIEDLNKTLGEPLSATRTLLIDKIMAGFAKLSDEAEEEGSHDGK